MIAILGGALRRFLNDPVGALEEMRSENPGPAVAAMALLAATLVTVVVDFIYGPLAFPHSMEPDGKRFDGPVMGAFVEVCRIYATAALVWFGVRVFLKDPISGTDAMWMTVPYALALVVLELIQVAVWILAIVGISGIYGAFFMLGYVGAILVLIASVRALSPRTDWFGALPVGFGAAVLGLFMPPIVLPLTAGYLLIRGRT